jgi:adenylate kinase
MDTQTQTIADWLGAGSINLFGRPFAGKDTQGKKLADLFGGVLIGGGDILRSHHDSDEIEKIMATGGIIPSDVYESIIIPYFAKPEFAGKPLILSAVGRSHGEEPIIMKAAEASGHNMKAVIYMHLSEEEVWRRFETALQEQDRGHRADDHRSVLKTRLNKFQDKTVPVIDFYREKGLLIEIDGTLSRDDVMTEILSGLAATATATA